MVPEVTFFLYMYSCGCGNCEAPELDDSTGHGDNEASEFNDSYGHSEAPELLIPLVMVMVKSLKLMSPLIIMKPLSLMIPLVT